MTIHITTKRYDIKIETEGNSIPVLLNESLLNAADEVQAPASHVQLILEGCRRVERVTVEDYLPFPKSIS